MMSPAILRASACLVLFLILATGMLASVCAHSENPYRPPDFPPVGITLYCPTIPGSLNGERIH